MTKSRKSTSVSSKPTDKSKPPQAGSNGHNGASPLANGVQPPAPRPGREEAVALGQSLAKKVADRIVAQAQEASDRQQLDHELDLVEDLFTDLATCCDLGILPPAISKDRLLRVRRAHHAALQLVRDLWQRHSQASPANG